MDTFEFAGSSMLQSGSYDPEKQELRLTFKGGKSYVYDRVPEDEVAALRSAGSAGSYFLEAIRDSYSGRRV